MISQDRSTIACYCVVTVASPLPRLNLKQKHTNKKKKRRHIVSECLLYSTGRPYQKPSFISQATCINCLNCLLISFFLCVILRSSFSFPILCLLRSYQLDQQPVSVLAGVYCCSITSNYFIPQNSSRYFYTTGNHRCP